MPTEVTLDACRLLTVDELAERLRLSARTCWRMAALSEAGRGDGFPKPITIGPRLRRWRAVDVAAYLGRLAGERKA
jgi:predicted DNA-binding transcriptional regulator AlpA